jgi:Tfp pilus assembly protein PilN
MGGLPEQIKPALERELEELRRQLAEIKQAERQRDRAPR